MADFEQYNLPDPVDVSLQQQQYDVYKTQDGVTPFDQVALPSTTPASSPTSNPTVSDFLQVIGGNIALFQGGFQSRNYSKGQAGWQITDVGNVEFNTGTFRGQLIAGSIDIPDATTANSFHVDSSGNAWFGSASLSTAVAKILNTGAATFTNVTITGGTIATTTLNKSVMSWTTDIVFSSASATQVNWTSGTIKMQDGTTYSISSGNTGTMSALTYIFLDTAVSTTVLQITTTYSNATSDNRILLSTAQNHTAGASVLPFGSSQPIINGTDQITALSITAASIAAGTITAAKLSVSQLSAIAADMGSITAGTIVLSASGYFRSGQTDYATGTGFFLGISGGATKFSIGNDTNYVRWDGSTLDIAGVSKVSKSYTSGEAINSGDAVAIGYYQSDGGIVYDTKATGSSASASSISQALTVANQPNRIVVVHLSWTNSRTISSITFGGSAMTQVYDNTAGGVHGGMFYLLAPATGSQTFAVTFSAATPYAFDVRTYYGVSQVAPEANGQFSAGTSSPQTISLVTIANGAMLFGGTNLSTGGAFPSSSTGFTNNTSFINNGNGGSLYTGDLGIRVIPGSQSLTVTPNNIASLYGGFISMAPATAPTFGYVVKANASASSLYSTPTIESFRANAFIGFANATVAANAAVSITIAGEVTGLSGLTSSSSFYYLSNTAGAIATSAGTNSRKVGLNITTTSLLITNIW